MSEWVSEWVSERASKQMSEQVSVSEWVSERVSMWLGDERLTYPSTLLRDPLGDLLHQDELTDKANDLVEEPTDASLQDGNGHPVPETQERNHAPPVDVTVTKKPARIEGTHCISVR